MTETVSPDMKCVYVDTNLDTRLMVLVDDHETIFDFKEKLCKEHHQCFPKLGEIDISAVKVKRQGILGLLLDFHLPDSMFLSMVFKGVSHNCWFVFVDAAVRIVELPKIAATDSLLLDGYNKNQNQEDLETGGAEKRKLEQLSSDGEKSRKKPKVDDLSQSAGTATELSPREKQDDPLTEAKEKEIEVGEKSLEDVIRDNIESSDNLVSHTENHLDITTSGLTTRPDTEKKKKKRKKRSKDDINQSSATTSSRDATVNEIDGGVPANVDATPLSLPSSNLDHSSSAEARQKENDMGDNVVEDVGRDKIEADNLMENPLNTNSGLTARPDTEKNQSLAAAAALTTSRRDIVNEINGANVDYVDDSFESLPVPREENPFVEAAATQKDIDMCDGDDINQSSDVAIPTSRDVVKQINEVPANNAAPESLPIARGTDMCDDDANINQSSDVAISNSRDVVTTEVPDNAALESLPIARGTPPFAESSQKENEIFVDDVGRDNIEPNSVGLMATRPDKSSKDDINQSFPAATGSKGLVNEINGDTLESLSISTRREDLGTPYAEATQIETETGEKINDDIVGGGKAAAVDNIQPFNVEIDADEAESVNPTKKRKSKNSKTPAEEHTLVAAHNTEPIKAADGEEPDKVLGSFKEKNETTEENMGKTGKKSKKKHSLKVAMSPEVSVEVNSTPLEETCHINSTNDSFVTPAKKDTETDASLLKKCYEENEGDMGDNFGCSQNQEKPDQVGGGGGVKSLKEKSGLDLQPSASTNVSLSSFKTKERKSGVQQSARLGTYRVQQSRLKSVSVRAAAVKSKKQDLKKTSSNPVVVMKTNFFKDAENCNSSEDEYKKTSHVSTKTQGNNLAGGASKVKESLQDRIRRSSSYKKALILAQSQPDIHDDSPEDSP